MKDSEELEGLRDFRDFIFEECWHVAITANDLWAWATADYCRVPTDDLDIFWMARQKYGREGECAFLRLYTEYDEPPDPQEPWFDKEYMDRDKYAKAKEWIASIRCECEGQGKLAIEHCENKACCFGWKIHRPMYDEPPKGERIERYW